MKYCDGGFSRYTLLVSEFLHELAPENCLALPEVALDWIAANKGHGKNGEKGMYLETSTSLFHTKML